jgi:hypothetical protein
MKRTAFAVLTLTIFVLATAAEAGRVRVTRKGPRGRRTTVTVRTGFPIRRTLPAVVVRPAPVVRVAPRAYLAPVAFGAVVVASLPAHREWHSSEALEREDGWTDFTMDVDRRGTKLFLQIDRGAAQISFAEVVFENGETQVVDFNDHVHRTGVYELLDFRNGRKVDHVRVVAKASTRESEITLHLAS